MCILTKVSVKKSVNCRQLYLQFNCMSVVTMMMTINDGYLQTKRMLFMFESSKKINDC